MSFLVLLPFDAAVADGPLSVEQAKQLELSLEGSHRADVFLNRSRKPDEMWWGVKHQKFVRVIQAGCRDMDSPVYANVRHFVHINLRSSLAGEPTYASLLGTTPSSDPPLPSAIDEFVERACGILTRDASFSLTSDYCFVSEQELAAFEWTDGTIEEHRKRNAKLLHSLRPSMLRNCNNWMKDKYLSRHYLASREAHAHQIQIAERAQEEKAKKELARQREEASNRERAAQRAKTRALLEKQFIAEVDRLSANAGVTEKNRVVWQSGRELPEGRFPDIDTQFNTLNVAWEAAKKAESKESQFVPPTKGEFETTPAYTARLNALRVEHQKHSLAQREQQRVDFARNWPATLELIFHEHLGNLSLESLTYNADAETFAFRIKSPRSPFQILATLDAPLATAPALKPEIESAFTVAGRVGLVFSLNQGVMRPEGLLVRTEADVLNPSIVSSTRIPLRFGQDSANTWLAMKQTEAHEAARRRDAEAQRMRERQRNEAEARRAAYQHNGPFLQKGALVCTDARSMIRAAAIQRANNQYVSMPAECIVAQGDFTPVTDLQRMNGGLIKVVIKSNGTPIFSMERYLVH